MERIKALMGTFSPSEIGLLEHYLVTWEYKGKNLQLELFHLIRSHPDIDMDQASRIMYGETGSKAFLMTKARLYDRMMEVMVLSSHFSPGKSQKFSQHLEAVVGMRKLLLFATQIHSRGLRKQAEELLRKVVQQARATGHPELELDALFRLRTICSQDKMSRDYFELSSEINRSLRALEQDLNFVGLREVYAAKHERVPTSREEKLEFMETQLPEAEEQLRQYPSMRAQYSYHYLKVRHYGLLRQYEKQREAIQQQIEFLEAHPSIQSDFRLASPVHQLARLETVLGNYDLAVQHLQKAKAYFRFSHHNYFVLALFEILIRFHQRDLTTVNILIETLERHCPYPAHTPQWANLRLLKTFYYYFQGDHQVTRKMLHDTAPLHNPKSGFFHMIRIFEIQLALDMGDFDFAASRVESLRKYISRQGATPRIKIIFKMLKKLELNGFQQEPVPKEADFLEKLKEHSWDPLGVEVLPFEEWYGRYLSPED